MSAAEITFASARQLAAQLARRELSAVEVMHAFLAQIERVNPTVNAIVTLRSSDELLADAAAADAQARGRRARRPTARPTDRDQGSELTRGLRTTFGSPLYRDFVPTSDDALRRRVAPRRRDRHRQDQHAGVRRRLADVQRGVRRDAQSVRPRARLAAAAAAAPPSRSPAACCRLPTAPISAARCAIPRASATSSASGRRRGACRAWPRARRRHAGRARPDGAQRRRSRAAAVRHGRSRRARSVVATANRAACFAVPPHAISRARESLGASVWGAIPSSPPSPTVCNTARSAFVDLGCDVEDGEPDLSGVDELFQTLRAVGYARDARPRSRRQRAKLKDTVIWNIEQGLKLTPRISSAPRACKRHSTARVGGVLLERTSSSCCRRCRCCRSRSRSNGYAQIDGVPMHTYIDWMATCYAISCLGVPAISVPCGFSPYGLAGRFADRRPPGRDLDVLALAQAFEQATLQRVAHHSSLARSPKLLAATSAAR